MPRCPAVAAVLAMTALACAGCRHEVVPSTPGEPAGSGPAVSATPATPPPGPSAGDAAPPGPVVRVEDDGETLDVTQGTTITFELARHAGTGFEWLPAPTDGGVLVQNGERRSIRASEVDGAPKLDVYELVARSPGTVTVEMQLRRPWQERPPVKSVRVTIRVR